MAIVYGLTDQGLMVKTRPVIREDLNAALRQAFGNSIKLSDRSIFGIIVGILADRIGELWELAEAVNSSQDPDKAAKAFLDALAVLTGTFRPHASPSTVTLTLTGVALTVVPSLTEFATLSTNKNFSTLDPVVLVAVPAWAGLTTYPLGARVSNSGGIYQNIQAGTSAASVGPAGTLPDFTADGTCLWTFVGLGAAAVDSLASSVDDGPIVATRKDISVIVNSIGGLVGVTNLADASLGRLDAQDTELRSLREDELGAAGSSPFDALLAKLRKVSGVTSVTLFPNNTDITDADGVPPHSIESLIRGGVNQDIFNALLANVAAGIGTRGNQTGTATDSAGNVHAEAFSRATEIPVFIRTTVTEDASVYPSDGDTQIQNAIIAYGATQSTGRDAVRSALSAQAFKVTGVLDVTSFLLYTDVIAAPVAWVATTAYVATPGSRNVVTNDGGRAYICITSGTSGSTGPSGTGTDFTDGSAHWYFLGNSIVISSRQLATYSTANLSVTSIAGTP